MNRADNTLYKTDFYKACRKYFPGCKIKKTTSIVDRNIVFTDCIISDRVAMRYCPKDKYGYPAHVMVFVGKEHFECPTAEDLDIILSECMPEKNENE